MFNFGNTNKDAWRNDNQEENQERNVNQETGGGAPSSGGGGGGNPSSGAQTGNAPPHAFGPSAAAALAKDPVAAAVLAPNLASTAAAAAAATAAGSRSVLPPAALRRPGDEEEQRRRRISGVDLLPTSFSTPTSEGDGKMAKPVPVHERIALSWSGINVTTIPKGVGKKRTPAKAVLSDVTGLALPGTLMAVMGASGAGKTTLLNILNFRTKSSPNLKVEGTVMMNGHSVNSTEMADVSVFVQQEDIFMSALTCREHLEFHAKLRMKTCTPTQKKERVEEVLTEMGLKRCEHVRIGGHAEKGLSGGEMKRLNFATEILRNPTLIFCDEPTSGLDSYMAMELVKLLKRLASFGNTIICTIHQPSSQIFGLFDYICLMAEGHCAFIGVANQCLQVFADAEFPVPLNYNPFDHYIFTLAVIPGREDRCRKKVSKIVESFRRSETYIEMKAEVKRMKKSPITEAFWRPDNDICTPLKNAKFCCAPFIHGLTSFAMIFERQLKAAVREPISYFLRLFGEALLSLILGLTWLKVRIQDDSSNTNVPGALFSFITMTIFSTLMTVVMVIPIQMPIIARDYLSGVYKIPVYYLAVTIFYTIDVLLCTLINTSIIFWMMFNGSAISAEYAFPRILGVMLLTTLTALAMGMLFSSIANSFEQATTYSMMSILFMIFAGFFIPQGEIIPLFKVFQYLSPWFYAQELSMFYVYNDLPVICQYGGPNMTYMQPLETEMMKEDYDKLKVKNIMADMCHRRCPTNKHDDNCCDNFLSGQGSMDRFQIEVNIVRNFVTLVGLMAGIHIIAIIVLTSKMYCKKK